MRRPDESVVHGSAASPRDLPSVDRLLQHEAVRAHLAEHGHTLVVAEARLDLFIPLYQKLLSWFFLYCYPIARWTVALERRFAVR